MLGAGVGAKIAAITTSLYEWDRRLQSTQGVALPEGKKADEAERIVLCISGITPFHPAANSLLPRKVTRASMVLAFIRLKRFLAFDFGSSSEETSKLCIWEMVERLIGQRNKFASSEDSGRQDWGRNVSDRASAKIGRQPGNGRALGT